MKIVHICLRGPYTDNWGYQENIMPKMQKLSGHDVTVIAPTYAHTPSGEFINVEEGDYVLSDGVRVIRIKESDKYGTGALKRLFVPYDLYSLLKEISPDLIMLHGLTVYSANGGIIKYLKKNKDCRLVGDTHEFDANSESATSVKAKLIKKYKVSTLKKIYPYFDKIYAITPNCMEYAEINYGIKKEEMELLPLGYDPTLCPYGERDEIRKEFRENHSIEDDDILVVHGGKIIKRRKTPEAILGVMKIQNPKVKMVIFGGIDSEMKPEIETLLEKYKDRVIYLGSLTPEEYYKVYLSSDIALFPGGQSVLWQEAIGCGLPLAVGNDKGLEYLDRGGNAVLINQKTAEGIYSVVSALIENGRYLDMRKVAEGEAREFFSYKQIAERVTLK